MDPNDYPSDSDESDEDFRPGHDCNSGSEIESDDAVDDQHVNGDDEPSESGKKRKRKAGKTAKKKAKSESKPLVAENIVPVEDELDEEEEKRKTDALWADFLAGTGSSNSSSTSLPKESSTTKPVETVKTVTKIFEFAGEAVEVTKNITVSKEEKVLPKPALASVSSNLRGGPPRPLLGRPSGGGLGSVLNQIGKKNKLSTLEKTKLDWNSFKRTEGIEEELQTHNKGKNGYLEKQDFLERADLRQFEIEKSIRQTSRSNR
ncbi:craniofacial development protein 1 [Topomyia yanbarensis]|uniref:craniofacial development protein 1 n=1 Tax=Topomyia yanbarensis TaxID=2498891 RepID=UPI00273C3F4B|nr:craniofacial development protein 1 [Topomyia yanbarensis]